MTTSIFSFPTRVRFLIVILAAWLSVPCYGGVLTAIGSSRTTASGSSLAMSLGTDSWPAAQEISAGSLKVHLSQAIALDEGAEYILQVTAQNAGDHTVHISPPSGYVTYIEGVERSAFKINGPTSGSVTTPVHFFVQRRWSPNAGFVGGSPSGTSGDELGESGSMVLGHPNDGSLNRSPHLEFNMGRSRNGTPLPKLSDLVGATGVYAGIDAKLTGTGPFTINTPQTTVVLTTVPPAVTTTPAGSSRWITFSLPGQASSPFLVYEFTYASTTVSGAQTNTATITKFYVSSGTTVSRKYQMKIAYGPFAPAGNGPERDNFVLEDWREILPTNTSVARYVRLSRSYNSTALQATDVVTVADNSGFSNPVSVTTNVYDADPDPQYPSLTGYAAYAFRLRSSTQHGEQNYTTTSLDPLNPLSRGFALPDGRVEILDLGLGSTFPSNGLPSKTYRTWGNLSPSKADGQPIVANDAWVETRTYSADWSGALVLPNSIEQHVGTTLLSKSTLAHGQQGFATINGAYVQTATRHDFAAVSPEDKLTTVTKFYRADAGYANPLVPDLSLTFLAGLPYAVELPDGTKRSYVYELGSYDDTAGFTVGGGTSAIRITCLLGVVPNPPIAPETHNSYNSKTIDPIRLIAGKSSRTVQILNYGRLVRAEVYVVYDDGGVPTFETTSASWQTYKYNAAGRLIQRKGSDNTSYDTIWYDVGRKWKEYTEESTSTGVVTEFGYDSMDRLKTISRAAAGDDLPGGGKQVAAQLTSFEYDAALRLKAVRQGPTGDEKRSTEYFYDNASRITSSTTEGITTKYTYPNGGRDTEITFHYGSFEAVSQTITRAKDGRVESVTGAAAVSQYHDYDFESGKFYHRTRLADNNFTATTGRVSKVTYDLLGRVVEQRSNGFGTNGNTKPLVTHSKYNALGQLERTYTREEGATIYALQADQRFAYDALGNLTASGLDINNDGALTPLSPDRYTEFDTSFFKDSSSVWWLRSTRKTYHTNGEDGTYASSSKTRLGALPTGINSEVVTTDYFGSATTETVTINSIDKSHVLKVTRPDGSALLRTLTAGFTTSEKLINSALTTASATTYAYDGQGRRVSATDTRTGTSKTTYFLGTGRPENSYDARNVLVGTYGYDGAGRLITSSNAAGTARFAYNNRGQLTQHWGSAGHPVKYEYDSFGDRIKQWTFRSTADFTQAAWPSGVTGDESEWKYDVNTGWLISKDDPDAPGTPNDNLVKYDYSNAAAERVVKRTWARSGEAVKTEYHYSGVTGDLTWVDYTDAVAGTTTDVSYTYTRTGQLNTVVDATGTRQFYYSQGQLAYEYPDNTFFHGYVRSTQRQLSGLNQVPGRYAGFMLGKDTDRMPQTNNPDLDSEMTVTYGYDNFGRVTQVDAGYKAKTTPTARAALSVPGTYAYEPQSNLWKKLTQGSYAMEREFEPKRDVLKNLEVTHATTGPLATFRYGTDDAGRREWAMQFGGSFDDVLPASLYRYGYSPTASGELTSATGYRGIVATDTSHPLSGRAFVYEYDSAGNRKSASVSGDTATYRSGAATNDPQGGNHLNQTLSRGTLKTRVSGTAHPNAAVTVGGTTLTRNGEESYWDHALPNYAQYTTVSLSAALSGHTTQTSSVLALTRPAQEELIYDADGNLLKDGQWDYVWDAENRLVKMTKSSTAGSWAPNRELLFTYDYLGRRVGKVSKLNGSTVSERKYFYEGWDLIAEIDASSGKIVRSYVWGLHPDGGLDGTNAAGALVLETVHTDTTLTAYQVVSDGAGNVTALIKQADGTVAASYEYGPFGENVRTQTTDPALAHQPFRFSTKFTDAETGLVYYGHRYYDVSLGRFINRDPIGEAGGANLYGFVGNSPNNSVDVLGLWVPEGTEFNPNEPHGSIWGDLEDLQRRSRIFNDQFGDPENSEANSGSSIRAVTPISNGMGQNPNGGIAPGNLADRVHQAHLRRIREIAERIDREHSADMFAGNIYWEIYADAQKEWGPERGRPDDNGIGLLMGIDTTPLRMRGGVAPGSPFMVRRGAGRGPVSKPVTTTITPRLPGDIPANAKVIQSGDGYYILEYANGDKTIRFDASKARQSYAPANEHNPRGGEDTAAYLTPSGKVMVGEGKHRLNAVAVDKKTVQDSVLGAPGWLEYEYVGPVGHEGVPVGWGIPLNSTSPASKQ